MGTLGGLLALTFAALAAWKLDALVWLVAHPEALGVGVAAVARAVGAGVTRLPHFRNGISDRTIDGARSALYGQVLRATDTLTVVQAELDSLYARVVSLRDSIPGE